MGEIKLLQYLIYLLGALKVWLLDLDEKTLHTVVEMSLEYIKLNILSLNQHTISELSSPSAIH